MMKSTFKSTTNFSYKAPIVSKMYFSRVFVALGLLAAANAQVCSPGAFGCGNNPVPNGVDGTIYVCNSSGEWVVSAVCGGPTCCRLNGANANCIC
ncbi:hypothetical protein F5B20DRAFT_521990 [Whalleya microplaca]|nr:hypothetical protein F5B20DRAFT_521990 [Whalleya microplaca]